MAPLPIFHGELKASLAAMMAFPNDLEKAELCACWQIASLFNSEMIEQNRSASITRIVRRSAQFANYQNEWTKNRNEGAIVGAVTLAMMSLIEDAPDLATWERAMLYTIDQVRNRKVKVNRSKLEELRTKYEKVYHFWGAWEDSEPGFNERHEFDERLLCAKATNFHNVIAAWNNSRSIEQAEVFDAPEITDVSATREYTIDIELVPKPGRPGRPRKAAPNR